MILDVEIQHLFEINTAPTGSAFAPISMCGVERFSKKKGQRGSSTLADKTDFDLEMKLPFIQAKTLKVLWCPLVRVWMKCSARRNAL